MLGQNHNEDENGTNSHSQNKKVEPFKMIHGLTSAQGALIVTFILFLIGAAFNYYGSNPRILYVPLVGICILFFYLGHLYIRSEIYQKATPPPDSPPPPSTEPRKNAPPTNEPAVQKKKPSKPKRPLASLSDGQRFVLKQKLSPYAGTPVSLVLVGNDPQKSIVFEQLKDIFGDAGWKVSTTIIGMVGVAGTNFPDGPYLTGGNMAAPILEKVFSIFLSVDIKLPLTPQAFSGAGTAPDVVIVIH